MDCPQSKIGGLICVVWSCFSYTCTFCTLSLRIFPCTFALFSKHIKGIFALVHAFILSSSILVSLSSLSFFLFLPPFLPSMLGGKYINFYATTYFWSLNCGQILNDFIDMSFNFIEKYVLYNIKFYISSRLIGKDTDVGKDWRQEKRAEENDMIGWHHWLNEYDWANRRK